MNDAQLFDAWMLALAAGAAVVLIAASLLIGIIFAARRILGLALQALSVVEKIKHNTQGIWALKETNQKAARILGETEAIRTHGALLATALERKDDESAA